MGHAHAAPGVPRARLEPARVGVWLFLVTEAMLFAGLLSAHVALKAGSAHWGGTGGDLRAGPAALATVLLVSSSFTLARAVARGAGEARVRQSRGWIAASMVLGSAFLALQALEFGSLAAVGIGPRTNLSWSSFFVLTSVHGLHVALGLVLLARAWWVAGRSRGTSPLGLELAALYWHFVDVVWLGLFVLLYLP